MPSGYYFSYVVHIWSSASKKYFVWLDVWFLRKLTRTVRHFSLFSSGVCSSRGQNIRMWRELNILMQNRWFSCVSIVLHMCVRAHLFCLLPMCSDRLQSQTSHVRCCIDSRDRKYVECRTHWKYQRDLGLRDLPHALVLLLAWCSLAYCERMPGWLLSLNLSKSSFSVFSIKKCVKNCSFWTI